MHRVKLTSLVIFGHRMELFLVCVGWSVTIYLIWFVNTTSLMMGWREGRGRGCLNCVCVCVRRLKRDNVFDLIREHNLFDAISDRVITLMDFDVPQTIELLLTYRDKISVSIIIIIHFFSPPSLHSSIPKKYTCLFRVFFSASITVKIFF